MGGRVLALLLSSLAAAAPSFAGVTPELQRQVRASTFEVVMKKPPEGAVRYEKPLPLELLPYIERTDPYRSIGTAFALGGNTYATAAHVLLACVDSQYGPPALRASDGSIHAVAKILKFSMSEDFVVFSLSEPLNVTPSHINRSPHVDDVVFAVGNALGEGIVIRDGLFTSETPEQQDGRWRWIRFSAAASPGNSGGPLLDAAGAIIGLVIAKSANENLNYALPIANVVDAPPRARFDQRVLTKLPFMQGSTTYELKDAFPLPLSWEGFVRAYQALAQRHNTAALQALLTTEAAAMFPQGGAGVDSILYTAGSSGREPGMVIQREDGTWVIQRPRFQFTELAGNGKVGVAVVAGAALLVLHRGAEASDAGFYADSASFMDTALKALNLRRTVGTDQVRVTSLGPAGKDEQVTDHYGRTWQVRTWPVPFLDVYVVAELLPTPDGYVGVLEYAPSSVLSQLTAQLSVLANQVTLTYAGTLAQWQAFLARKALLPAALKEVTLKSGYEWTLDTPRFETRVPAAVLALDAHSELLLRMGYLPDRSGVIWDIEGAWWYRDAQEKAYLGLWRQPRPPPSAALEVQTRFEDLQAHRSPYDAAPVWVSSDAMDISVALPAPGSRAGTASSGVMYGLTLRLDGHPTDQRMDRAQTLVSLATHILERGVGEDRAASQGALVTLLLEASRGQLQEWSQACDHYGKDIRGRLCSQDIEQYLEPLLQAAYSTPVSSASLKEMRKTYSQREQALRTYWGASWGVIHNRDLWAEFLARNHLPGDTPHDEAVLAAESSLKQLTEAGPPTLDWATRAVALGEAYVRERVNLAGQVGRTASGNWTYRKRTSSCPAPATGTSGKGWPRLSVMPHSLEEYYPESVRRLAVEGTVVLSVKVSPAGCVTEAAVAGSSGSDELDDAALEWVYTATFLPAQKDGKPVEGVTPIAVAFKLS